MEKVTAVVQKSAGAESELDHGQGLHSLGSQRTWRSRSHVESLARQVAAGESHPLILSEATLTINDQRSCTHEGSRHPVTAVAETAAGSRVVSAGAAVTCHAPERSERCFGQKRKNASFDEYSDEAVDDHSDADDSQQTERSFTSKMSEAHSSARWRSYR